MNSRPTRAGLKMFLAVPPKTSLPKNTPTKMPTATTHRGVVGGSTSGKISPVTRNPSSISFLRMRAKGDLDEAAHHVGDADHRQRFEPEEHDGGNDGGSSARLTVAM